MKIINSHTALSAGGLLEKRVETEKKLNVWRGSPARIRQRPGAAAGEPAAPARNRSVKKPTEEGPALDPKTEAIKRILEALTGRKIEIADPKEFQTRKSRPEGSSAVPGDSPETPERKGWGLEYTETVTSSAR